MDCKPLRDVLDAYIDAELSPDAMAAADEHVHRCRACMAAADGLNALRRSIRRTVEDVHVPDDLERRVRRTLRPAWMPTSWRATRSPMWPAMAAVAAIVLLVLGLTAGVTADTPLQRVVVAAMDRAVVMLADAGPAVVEGTILCRDCELQDRHGERVLCDRVGHHGALVTPDGRIWNIIEQEPSKDLIHDEAMLGRRVRVRGRLFRDAGSIAIDAYEMLGWQQATDLSYSPATRGAHTGRASTASAGPTSSTTASRRPSRTPAPPA